MAKEQFSSELLAAIFNYVLNVWHLQLSEAYRRKGLFALYKSLPTLEHAKMQSRGRNCSSLAVFNDFRGQDICMTFSNLKCSPFWKSPPKNTIHDFGDFFRVIVVSYMLNAKKSVWTIPINLRGRTLTLKLANNIKTHTQCLSQKKNARLNFTFKCVFRPPELNSKSKFFRFFPKFSI